MRRIACSVLLLLPIVVCAASNADRETPPLVLFTGGRVLAQIVAPDRPSPLEDLAIQRINRTARDLFGFELPVISASKVSPNAPAIILGTPANNPLLQGLDPVRAPDGFLIQSLGPGQLALVSRGDRGVFNGAVYLAEFAMQAGPPGIVLQTKTVRRESPIRNRGTYNLVCWGLAPRYTLQDWKKVIDGMADDGMNLIYFWLSGIFRSKLFPESFIYPETPLTTDDIRQLIVYAHSRGIEFYLGTGVFAWFGIDDIAKYRPDLRDIGIPYMSRTLPAARQAMKQYLMELYDAFPDADGMWLEIGDEGDYACKDPACQKPIDEFGSKVSGQASPSFLKDFSAGLWQKYPKAKLVWGVGYPEAHKWDVKYYDELRKNFRDPRYSFLEVRQNWMLQDSQGILKPLRDFSANAMHWDQYYGLPLRDIGERARRIQEDQLAGYVVAFEPGFNTHSVFGRAIPFPIDAIPYRLTRFAYREFTFDPNLTWNDFRRRLLDHFFGENADPELADLTITLFEFMRTGPITGSFRELAHPVDGHEYGRMLKPRLEAIEARLLKLEPGLGPRARSEGLPLLRRAIQDLRKGYSVQ
jgi:hypothetical protein